MASLNDFTTSITCPFTMVLQVTMSRSATTGYHVVQVLAKDPDEGRNGEIEYFVSDPDNTFQISRKSGIVYVANPLGFAKNYSLRVTARDMGVPQLSNWTTVEINVEEPNKNSLKFTKTIYSFKLVENVARGYNMGSLNITENVPVTYTMDTREGIPFEIDARSGIFRAVDKIDREQRQIYQFKVIATGAGGRTGVTLVTVRVLDVNDNIPQFTQSLYKVGIAKTNIHIIIIIIYS